MFKSLFFLVLIYVSYANAANMTYCVSHRANGFGELENSMAAIKAASSFEASAIEIDVYHTTDGETVVYHDKELERLVVGDHCPLGKKVSTLSYKNISKACRLINGEKIPTLYDALSEVSLSSSKLYIEIKDNRISQKDYDDIKALFPHRSEQIVFISFDSKVLRKIRDYRKKDDYFKNVKIVRLQSNGNNARLRFFDGIDAKRISRYKVKEYQDMNKIVGVYTKNSKKDILSYAKKGVNFITTDDYKLCTGLVKN